MSESAKRQQGYDNDPPRCVSCVYFRREAYTRYAEREKVSRSGKVRVVKFQKKVHPLKNPLVDRCSFGNFLTKPHAICDEWHSRQGERLESDGDNDNG